MLKDKLVKLLDEVIDGTGDVENLAEILVSCGVTMLEPNTPLPKSELAEMEGEPVWIEFIHPGNTCPAHWRIWRNKSVEPYEWDAHGIDWVAYRRKPAAKEESHG